MLVIGVVLMIGGAIGAIVMWASKMGFLVGFATLLSAILGGILFIWMGLTTDKLKEILRLLKGESSKKLEH